MLTKFKWELLQAFLDKIKSKQKLKIKQKNALKKQQQQQNNEFLLKTSFLVYFAKFIAFQKWYKMEDR